MLPFRAAGDPFPDTAEIGGFRWPIRTDFRAGIRFSLAAQDSNLTPSELVGLGFSLFFGEEAAKILPLFGQEAVDVMLLYFSGGRQPSSPDSSSPGGSRSIRVFDFRQDADYILSEFFITARIDLESASLHWWKFLALFERLCTNRGFSKIIEYRVTDPRGLQKDAARQLRKLKQLYALEVPHARTLSKSEYDELLKKRVDQIYLNARR